MDIKSNLANEFVIFNISNDAEDTLKISMDLSFEALHPFKVAMHHTV